MASFNPTQIFEDGTTEEKGENARLSAFVGAIAVGDLGNLNPSHEALKYNLLNASVVKSTLGPKGMDKILQSASTGEILVTNDGATILKAIALDNAAAKVLVNISKVQDDEVGDGTTSVTVLAAELLREAEKLVDKKIHPQTIIEGYRIASQAALAALEKSAVDHSSNADAFRKDLLAIARTTLSSKVLSQDRYQFAELAVDAVLRMKGSSDLSHIQIIKKAGGKLSDSYLDEGFILDKKIGVNQPKRLEKAKILVANTAMDTDKIKIFGARVKVGSTGKLAELEKAEKDKMKAKVDKIKAHGINCFINRQLIYNWPEQLFSDAGIMSIEHADFDGIERLALVTGGEITSTFDHPDQVKLGQCDLIEEVIIGEDTLIKFSGVAAGQACTIVLRGATEQLLDEAERSLHDALAVLSQTVKEPRTTLGGGCAEMLMAKAVEVAAVKVDGKKQIAVGSFAVALRQLPTILADNAGYDSSDLVARLRTAIYDGMSTYGLDLLTPGGGIADMRELGVIESYKLKKAVVSSASEAAEVSTTNPTYAYNTNSK
ncbi:t-complex protein 1 subunit beta [Sclerotinia borealis F-4128]|uniref:CCT-beta n=1 Tax=Sclerotinia borealis (strain F-4128) TaxID=1432307 RepID=W9CUI3_SCLBF|nr:t-complex protein 1 subunit beta [Sclerotinia borealis F-4128]